MTVPDRSDCDVDVDTLANCWLDDDIAVLIPSDLTREEYHRLADFRLIDALLLYFFRDAAAREEEQQLTQAIACSASMCVCSETMSMNTTSEKGGAPGSL